MTEKAQEPEAALEDLDDGALYDLWAAYRESDDRSSLAARRSRRAGGILAKRYNPALLGFFRRRLGDDCQDVLSETIMAVLYGNFQARGSFRSFAFGVAYRKLLKEFTKRSKGKDFDPSVSSLNDLGPSVTAILDDRQRLGLVDAALARIPIANQQALLLYLIEGHSGPEVAGILGISLPAFRNRLRRGLEGARRELAALQSTGGDYEAGIEVIDGWERRLVEDPAVAERPGAG